MIYTFQKIGDTIVLPYATIRGNVTPLGRTVASAYVPEIQNGVIQKVVFTENKRNLSRFVLDPCLDE